VDRAPRGGATEVSSAPADAEQPQAPPLSPIPTGGSPRVLILFSDTGGGHRAAARALTDALKLLDPSCIVTVADPLIGQGPAVVKRLAALYSPMIRRSRAAWGAVYHTSNTRPAFAAIRAVFGPGVRKQVLELLMKHDPDVILSVHPLLNHIATRRFERADGRARS
jgi:1,2-diacylglycerol 3-beta-galactosyltransferase